MRLFVGVEIDDGVRREAGETMEGLRRRLAGRADARWVLLENLHLTVRFIGHVQEDRVEAVLGALDVPLPTAPFEIELGGCGRFPSRGAPRVLWVGLTRGLGPLTALHQEFNRRLLPFGYEPEDRPFSAHLTLARFKDARGGHGRVVDDALQHVIQPRASQIVERVTVFESRLSPNGPRYSAVRQIRLPTS